MSAAGPERAERDSFVPALAYGWLTPLYDPVVRLTTRERAFKRGLLEQAQIQPGMRVLDLGCGTGTLAIWMKQHLPCAEVLGLDGDPEMLQRAEGKAKRAGTDVSFTEGMSFDLPYSDESFDRVVSTLFFHHLTRRDKARTLAAAHRVLMPGGQLHIADWGQPQDAAMKVLSYSIRLLDGREQTRDNLQGVLPRLIESAGFGSVSSGRIYRTIYGTMTLLSAQRSS